MREGRPSYTAAWVAAMRGLARTNADERFTDPIARDLVPQPYAWAIDLAHRGFAERAGCCGSDRRCIERQTPHPT